MEQNLTKEKKLSFIYIPKKININFDIYIYKDKFRVCGPFQLPLQNIHFM